MILLDASENGAAEDAAGHVYTWRVDVNIRLLMKWNMERLGYAVLDQRRVRLVKRRN